MNFIRSSFCVVGVVALEIFSQSTPPVQIQNTISISLLDFCPFHCFDKPEILNDSLPGYGVEIYNEIYESEGFVVQFVGNSFSRGMVEVNEGDIDAISGPLKFSPEDLKEKIRQMPLIGPMYGALKYPTMSVGVHHSSCVYKKGEDEWQYTTPKSLSGKAIGAAQNYDYGQEMNGFLEQYERNVDTRVERLTGDNIFHRNILRLNLKRIDVILMDRTGGKWAIKKAENKGVISPGQIVLSGCTGESAELYLAFSSTDAKRAQYLGEIFDRGVKRLRDSGKLQDILAKYGLVDWIQ
ncbi:MAG: transporter substrate-binding domain-containing protein [Reichenbachiella sp.]